MLYHKTFELGPDRDWVVFVHGAGGSSSIWFKQLRAYREHFNVLLLDLRGHGQSNQLQQVVKGHYSFRAVTEDILRLLDHLRIPHARLSASPLAPSSSATWPSSARAGQEHGARRRHPAPRYPLPGAGAAWPGRPAHPALHVALPVVRLHHHAAPAPSGVPQPLRARGPRSCARRSSNAGSASPPKSTR